MKVLVLGGAGYIGSVTVHRLIEKGYSVVVIDNLLTGHREAVHPKAIFYEGDLRDEAFLDTVLSNESIDAVIHFAASSLVGESVTNPGKYYDNNVYGTLVLLKSLVKHNVDKVIFSSTAAVYGEPDRVPILETDPTHPRNPYGETKLAMERMFHWFDVAHGIKSIALRYFNVAGAIDGRIGEAHEPETHLIPLILQVPLCKRDYISVYGADYPTRDGSCIRDYIHVQDIADAHILAMERLQEKPVSDVYNLGNGQGFSVFEMIDAAREVTGHPIPMVIEDRRPGDPAVLVASNEKAVKELGWTIQYPDVKDIIRSAWEFHKNFPNGYKKV